MPSRLDQALRNTEPDVWRQLIMPSCLDSGTCLGYCPCMARRFMVDLWAATSKISSSSLELSEFSPSCARDPLTLAVPAIPEPLCCCCCCCKYFIRSTRDILDTSAAAPPPELSDSPPSCVRDPLTLAAPAIPGPLCCCCCCCKDFIRSTRDILDTSVTAAGAGVSAATSHGSACAEADEPKPASAFAFNGPLSTWWP